MLRVLLFAGLGGGCHKKVSVSPALPWAILSPSLRQLPETLEICVYVIRSSFLINGKSKCLPTFAREERALGYLCFPLIPLSALVQLYHSSHPHTVLDGGSCVTTEYKGNCAGVEPWAGVGH